MIFVKAICPPCSIITIWTF